MNKGTFVDLSVGDADINFEIKNPLISKTYVSTAGSGSYITEIFAGAVFDPEKNSIPSISYTKSNDPRDVGNEQLRNLRSANIELVDVKDIDTVVIRVGYRQETDQPDSPKKSINSKSELKTYLSGNFELNAELILDVPPSVVDDLINAYQENPNGFSCQAKALLWNCWKSDSGAVYLMRKNEAKVGVFSLSFRPAINSISQDLDRISEEVSDTRSELAHGSFGTTVETIENHLESIDQSLAEKSKFISKLFKLIGWLLVIFLLLIIASK